MVRLCLGAVSLALLIVVAAPSTAGAALPEPRFDDGIALRVPADPFRLAASDLNGDGTADLATVNWNSSSVSVMLAAGGGAFAKRIDYRAPRHPAGLTVADVNGDARPDLVAASHNPAGSVVVLLNGGGGRFLRGGTYAAGPNAWAVAAADVNGDGPVDLLTAHHGGQQLGVLIGIGDGRFHGVQRYRGPAASDVAVGDLDGDRKPDVVLASRKGHVVVRLGRGDGSFGDPRTYKSGRADRGIALADLSHDQNLDVATGSEDLAVLLGNGDGTLRLGWREDGGYGVDAVAAGDFNADGNLDLLVNGYPPDVLLGSGDGRFHTYETDEEGAGVVDLDSDSRSGVAADFNGDGLPDLAIIALCDYDCDFGTVLVWRNWSGLAAKPCVVPDVTEYSPVGETVRDAGCSLGRVSHRYSRTVDKGSGISQRPKPGTALPPNGSVDVVISLGRRYRAR
jgi:hypothetical protein